MSDGLVNLQPDLRATQDDVLHAARTLLGLEQRDTLLGDARRVPHQVNLFYQLVAPGLILSAEGVRIGAPLNLVSGKRCRHEAGAGLSLELVDVGTEAR